ncbi:MAG: hypothetical protein Q8922_15415 [Bacteroidota bacterium]|nr:hypothetical protein [Bacteroidota bacterium]MDP4234781.1 hypothetical protein [Bacteroidota bacterium]MDP4244139.1 hypothetical protein [Bacteroidota bacterium]MDP4289305.1 hypothetical protein [Bacteroidota bacterium]
MKIKPRVLFGQLIIFCIVVGASALGMTTKLLFGLFVAAPALSALTIKQLRSFSLLVSLLLWTVGLLAGYGSYYEFVRLIIIVGASSAAAEVLAIVAGIALFLGVAYAVIYALARAVGRKPLHLPGLSDSVD